MDIQGYIAGYRGSALGKSPASDGYPPPRHEFPESPWEHGTIQALLMPRTLKGDSI